MKTRISVIISLNREKRYFEDCIGSVLNQSINDFELSEGYERNIQVILVDNPNHPSEIAKSYANDYQNVEYLCGNDQFGDNLNNVIEFAQGDYIIFLDSNNQVTEKAFEMMYRVAIRDGSEMVTANVLLSNSKNYFESDIHVKAFSGTKDLTHITESPELLYDATIFNKLFKRSFFKEHEFQFSKQIAYDDLLAFRCHFFANKISKIFEPCFIWRLLNGKIGLSSNSSSNETENLMDRLSVLRSLDDYFEKNVENALLNETKIKKCISYDLPLFINEIRGLDEEDSKIFMDLLNEYIKTNVDVEDFKYLDEFDKLKYEYLIDNNYEKLMSLLTFQFDELMEAKMYLKDSHIMIDVDKEIFKESSVSIDNFIENQRKRSFIQQVKFRDNDILVKGLVFIPGLKIENYEDIEYSFYLLNSLTQKKFDLKYKHVKIENFNSIPIPYGKDFSYEASGYEVYIPYSIINSDFLGENRIVVNFKQNGIDQTFFAGQTQKKILKKSNLKVKLIENKYFIFKYSLLNELIIDFSFRDVYSNISFEDNKLSIDSADYNRELFVFYPKDSINSEEYVPLTFNNEKNCYSIDIDDLSKSEGMLTYADGEPIVCDSNEITYFHSDDGTLMVNTKKDHFFKIDKHDNITLVSNISEKDNTFIIDAKLHHLPFDMGKLKSATLYLMDDKRMEVTNLSEGTFSKDGTVKFKMDMSNEENIKNLYHGYHTVYARYDFGDTAFSTSVQLLKHFSKRFSIGNFSYRVYRGNGNLFRIQVKRKWDFIHNSPRKRKLIGEKIYNIFRKITRINNKRIIFQSMGGEKYSCNPRYLYEYINENYPEYECIWFMKDEHTPINGNAKRVRIGTMEYYYYLATSKYLIDNIAFSPNFIKRKGQKVIQTMHGTPLKTLGLDAPGYYLTEESRNNALRRWSYWDYLTVQSDYVSKIAKRCFKYSEKFLNFGYPRTDILYTKNNKEDIDRIKEKLGIPLDKKVILYAPTFRVEKEFDLMIDLNSFKKSLSDDYVFILRLHHLSSGYKQPKNEDFVYDLSKYESSEELYLISDILITDYSSVMFDYAILDRPILLFTYDLDIYRDELRGFYIDIVENRPGPILKTSKELEDAIINIDEIEEENKDLRREFCEKFNQFENGNSSEKIFKDVFLK